MGTIPKEGSGSAEASIEALRQSWLDALRSGDVGRLATLVTDDSVVVHGTGRCVSGKEALKSDFRAAFEAFSIEQTVSPVELVVRGRWALEIADVETKLTPRSGGQQAVFPSTTVTALKQQADGSWKVGRVLGVVAPCHSRELHLP
jgi:uncharacterized protein (TIGR02246 family)